MKHFLVVSYEAIMRWVMNLPRFHLAIALKVSLLRMMGATVGHGVTIYPGVWITPGRNLVIGDKVDLALDVLITTSGGVDIGSRTLVGYRSQILSSNHNIPPIGFPIIDAGHQHKAVRIGSDVWIGCGCTILPGVEIGEGSVVAAGSVVTKNVAPHSIVAGVPAKLVRRRSPPSVNEVSR